MTSTLVGQTLLSQFRVDAYVASGGMGTVYRVWDLRRSVPLAIKVLTPELASNPAFLERFRAEAAALAKLQHPNIVRFYGLRQDGGLTFMIMDYVEGTTLRDEIRQNGGPLPPERILQLIRSVGAALNYAHELGYVHCDVKPANILIDRTGKALVSDFGISRLANELPSGTGPIGTASHMAPEQIRGDPPAISMDVYALGVLLYEMLTGGRRPFVGDSAGATGSTNQRIRWEHLNTYPPSPRQFNANIPLDLEGIVLRCLEKDPARRFPNVPNLLKAVEGPLLRLSWPEATTTTSGRPLTAIDRRPQSWPEARKKRALIWALAAIALAGLFFVLTRGAGDGNQTFSLRAYDPSRDLDAQCIRCAMPSWDEPTTEGTREWNLTLPAGIKVLLNPGWCAASQELLDANWRVVQYESVVVDGHAIPFRSFPLLSGTNAVTNAICYEYAGVLTGWSKGVHQYEDTMRLLAPITDGTTTYQAGTYVNKFTVEVR